MASVAAGYGDPNDSVTSRPSRPKNGWNHTQLLLAGPSTQGADDARLAERNSGKLQPVS